MRCGKCANCIKLESEKRLALMAAQPYHLIGGRLFVDTNPRFDTEAWNKTVQSLPCWSEAEYIKVSQVKVGDVLHPFDKIEWKHWEGDDKPLTVKAIGGRSRLFTLVDENGKEYRASGQRLTCYSHTIVVRDGKLVGKFFCKYW